VKPRLAIVTGDGVTADDRAAAISAALESIPLGAAIVLLRDRTIEPAEARRQAGALRAIGARRHAPLFVHRALVAANAADSNLHFPDEPSSLAEISRRRAAGSGGQLFSVSTHDVETAALAASVADIVYLGPIWPTPGKPNAIGTAALLAARSAFVGARGRLFAIGGVTSAERVIEAIAAGADGVAGIRSFAGPSLAALAAAFQS
jgi:thiamine-phosphate pyrophosphorylase